MAMTKQIELMQNMILQMQQSIMSGQQVPTNNYSTRHPQRTSSTPAQNNFWNANQTKYCHTHGACYYHSNNCRSKGPSHQDM